MSLKKLSRSYGAPYAGLSASLRDTSGTPARAYADPEMNYVFPSGQLTLDSNGGFSVYVEDSRLYRLDVYGATPGGLMKTDLNLEVDQSSLPSLTPYQATSMGSTGGFAVVGEDGLLHGPQSPVSGERVVDTLRRLSLSPQDPAYSIPASAPSISVSAAGAANTIASPQYFEPDGSFITQSVPVVRLGASYPNNLFVTARYISDAFLGAGYTSAMHCSYFFNTDAATFEFQVKGNGNYYRIWYTAGGTRYLAGSTGAISNDGSLRWVTVGFGSRTMRTIEIETSSICGRVAIGPSDSMQVASISPLVALVYGDSFVEGSGLTAPQERYKGFAPLMLGMLGIQRRIISGLGGTGYGKTNGSRVSLLSRVQTDVIDFSPDIVFHEGGLNDTSITVLECAAVFDAIREALPDCLQIVFSCPNPRETPVADRDAILEAAVAARPGMVWIPVGAKTAEFTGTGRVGSTTGSGNCDWAISSDGTHPSDAGHEYMARYRSAAVCNWLASAA